MIYLVTGGTGFTGSYVVRNLLADGQDVICLQRSGLTPLFARLIPESNRDRVRIVSGDVSSLDTLRQIVKEQKVDIVIHLASVMYPQSEESPAMTLQVNVIGMGNILELAREVGLRRVVWNSSLSVFGRLGCVYGDRIVLEDEVVYQPSRMYAATKMMCEYLANHYARHYRTDVIGLRVPRVYGIGKSSGGGAELMGMIRDIALGRPATIRNGDSHWTYLHIEDSARALVNASKIPPTKTTVFNLDDGGGRYDGRQLSKLIKRIRPEAKITVEAGGGVYDFPLLDTSPAREELGFVPKYSLEKGLRRAMDYYCQEQALLSKTGTGVPHTGRGYDRNA